MFAKVGGQKRHRRYELWRYKMQHDKYNNVMAQKKRVVEYIS